jgi:hypothetical protein
MIKLLLLLLLNATLFAGDIISLLPYKSNEFSPAMGQSFKLSYTLNEDADVTWQIYTPDNNLIRTIKAKNSKTGKHTLLWDGKDEKGTVIPDEAYNIVLTAQNSTHTQTIDPRFTGGEILKNLQTKIDKTGNISYTLSSPARVLVRAGIENGPMLRMISNWIPKNRGKVRQHWSMRDVDDLVDIATLPFGITVSAFTLPKHTIITINNKILDYYTYFKEQNLSCNTLPKEEQVLVKADKAISKHAYICRIKDRDPRLYLSMPKNNEKEQNLSVLTNGNPTLVKVSMHPEDEAILEKAKYEVSFFVDFEFTSEEELGFMPISWNFIPNGIDKGEHILTVNVSSFTGQVGVKSYKFILK